jgi:tripartite-type tricarboxylate transporter receptor subunit TctC
MNIYTGNHMGENSTMLTRRRLMTSSLALMASTAADSLSAQVTSKPVRVIVGFPAGGGTDVIARLLAEGLHSIYATVIVENKPGGAARLSVEYVKNSEPDGATMLFTPDFPITVYPHSFRALNYDPLHDLIPVAPTAISTLTFNIGPAVPDTVKTLRDFVAWCKANPGKAAYATTSPGGTPHFVGVMLSTSAGVSMQPVHYHGGAPALQDLIGGHVPASINPIGEAMPLAQQGALRILAITGPQRSKFLPDVPTMKESGYDVVINDWLGVFLPARTPDERVSALSRALETVVKSPEYADGITKFGNEPAFQTPAEFAARVKAETDQWGPVVKASGFVADD